jgi:translation initiation factor 1A
MPNTTGGKNYKKSKHSSGSTVPAFIDRQPDQMYARVIKNLGSRNMLAYCNDNKTRLVHVRGGLRKKVWINTGDIVLISLRDFEKDISQSSKEYEKGDILAKYDSEHMSKLKKMSDINEKLFMQLETQDGTVLAALGKQDDMPRRLGTNTDEDCGIVFDYGEDDKKPGDKAKELDSDSEKEIDIDDI